MSTECTGLQKKKFWFYMKLAMIGYIGVDKCVCGGDPNIHPFLCWSNISLNTFNCTPLMRVCVRANCQYIREKSGT